MSQTETLWMRIIGILLTLLGVVLLASPLVIYRKREKLIDTESIQLTAKRQKGISHPVRSRPAHHRSRCGHIHSRRQETAIKALAAFRQRFYWKNGFAAPRNCPQRNLRNGDLPLMTHIRSLCRATSALECTSADTSRETGLRSGIPVDVPRDPT
jgi:hypothetical protein